jgi:hypothetical protein
MSAKVVTSWSSPSDGIELARAEEFHIDPAGNLMLSTGRCEQVAAFAAGKWLSVEMVPHRGRDGRFVKRGA